MAPPWSPPYTQLCPSIAGDRNQGTGNAGAFNVGEGNIGDHNQGKGNAGAYNVGEGNSGNRNVGSGNVGDQNVGQGNSGKFYYQAMLPPAASRPWCIPCFLSTLSTPHASASAPNCK